MAQPRQPTTALCSTGSESLPLGTYASAEGASPPDGNLLRPISHSRPAWRDGVMPNGMMTGSPFLDFLIVGGGPAGRTPARVLARDRRRVVVIDAGPPRNYASRGIHNLLTRDGIDPMRLLRLG